MVASSATKTISTTKRGSPTALPRLLGSSKHAKNLETHKQGKRRKNDDGEKETAKLLVALAARHLHPLF
jgi:hypothetical protein